MTVKWESIVELEKVGKLPNQVDLSNEYEAERVVFLSDLHFPFVDTKIIPQILSLIQDYKPHRVVLNGDLFDFYDLSRFIKVPGKEFTLQDELDQGQEFIKAVRVAIGDSGIIDFIPGNHEDRLVKYLATDGSALQSLRGLRMEELVKSQEYGVTVHPREGFMLRPNFLVFHGTKVSKHSSYTCKSELDSHGLSGISGHTHRLGLHLKSDLSGTKSWYEQGCLCTLAAEYITGTPNWQHGFALGEFAWESDWFNVELVQIKNRELKWRGVDYATSLC